MSGSIDTKWLSMLSYLITEDNGPDAVPLEVGGF